MSSQQRSQGLLLLTNPGAAIPVFEPHPLEEGEEVVVIHRAAVAALALATSRGYVTFRVPAWVAFILLGPELVKGPRALPEPEVLVEVQMLDDGWKGAKLLQELVGPVEWQERCREGQEFVTDGVTGS